MTEISQHLEGLTQTQGEMLHTLEGLSADLEKEGADRDAIKAQLSVVSQELADISAKEKVANEDAALRKQIKDQVDVAMSSVRQPSKGLLIGGGRGPIEPGMGFFEAVANTDVHIMARNPELFAQAKAALAEMGSRWSAGDPTAKATLGDSTGAGGNIVPPNVLTAIIEIATAKNIYRQLLTVVSAGFVSGVDVPVEGLAPLRAVVAGYGATKANQNFTTSKYSATMYTIARIFDVGNQLIRNSRGAAENLVQSELGRAFALGESYYILNGSGSSEPKGILTSIGGSGGFWTTFTPSATTLAGSAAKGIATATGTLANRARTPDGVVVNAADFWTMASQGTDTAGFFFSPSMGPNAIDPTAGMLRIWGLPVYADPNMPANDMLVGAWKDATLFTGQEYRVDTSTEAGSRWDANETGFRGEEEIGFNADPYVVAGMFQEITHLIT